VRLHELAPAHPAAPASRAEAGLSKPVAHGGGRHGEAKSLQFADNPLITPAPVLLRQPQDQRSNLPTNWWTTAMTWVRPPFCDQSSMPPQQCLRCDEKRRPVWTWQEPAGRRQKEPIGPGDRGTRDSSPKNAELVPEHENLEVFEVIQSKPQNGELGRPPNHHVAERQKHETSSRPKHPILRIERCFPTEAEGSQATDEISAPFRPCHE
jgi:hypothetical protein